MVHHLDLVANLFSHPFILGFLGGLLGLCAEFLANEAKARRLIYWLGVLVRLLLAAGMANGFQTDDGFFAWLAPPIVGTAIFLLFGYHSLFMHLSKKIALRLHRLFE